MYLVTEAVIGWRAYVPYNGGCHWLMGLYTLLRRLSLAGGLTYLVTEAIIGATFQECERHLHSALPFLGGSQHQGSPVPSVEGVYDSALRGINAIGDVKY